MREIIDSHVHIYSPEVCGDPLGWAARRNELHWAEMISASVNRQSLQGWADASAVLADMEGAGIGRVVMLGWYWENQETCEMQNRWYYQWAAAHPGKLQWFASVNPGGGNRALDEVRRAADEGARGLGEMSPAGQDFSLRDPTFLRIAELAVDLGLTINFHVNEALGRNRPGRRFDNLSDFQWLATEYPDLKMILAHWGGLIPFFELNPAVRRDLKNVYYDTAASPLLYEPGIYRAVADVVGAEKILFGSDYPLLLYPRHERVPGFRRMLEEIRSGGLSEDELDLILHGNARRLFG